MIATVTLNPALDKTYTAARLILGQVNRTDSVKNIAGGKGINVTKVLRQYGYPVRALGFVGGYTGSYIENFASEIQAECAFTHIKEETRSSINILSQDGYVTEVLEPGPKVSGEELEAFMQTYEETVKLCELVVLSGSVPANIPADIYSRLIMVATEYNKKTLMDSSGEFLRQGVKAVPFMIKPNLKELEFLLGRKVKDVDDVIGAALTLSKEGISHVLVSMGSKGILYVCGNEILYAKAPTVKAVNTVGCGDSMVAAFAISVIEKETIEKTLRRASAMAAANAMTAESAVIPMDVAESLIEQIQIIKY